MFNVMFFCLLFMQTLTVTSMSTAPDDTRPRCSSETCFILTQLPYYKEPMYVLHAFNYDTQSYQPILLDNRYAIIILPTQPCIATKLPNSTKKLVEFARNEKSYKFHDLMNFAVKHNLDTTQQDADGYTALMWAAANGKTKFLNRLIKSGIRHTGSTDFISKKNNNGESALSFAAYGGHSKCLKILLKNNAHPDSTNTSGTSPLMQACLNDKPACAQLLLEGNANFAVQDNNKKTALDYVLHSPHYDNIEKFAKIFSSIEKKE